MKINLFNMSFLLLCVSIMKFLLLHLFNPKSILEIKKSVHKPFIIELD